MFLLYSVSSAWHYIQSFKNKWYMPSSLREKQIVLRLSFTTATNYLALDRNQLAVLQLSSILTLSQIASDSTDKDPVSQDSLALQVLTIRPS